MNVRIMDTWRERSQNRAFTPVSRKAFTVAFIQTTQSRNQFSGDGLPSWRLDRRARVGAGAGATPVSVRLRRHETFLTRSTPFVGHSRPSPSHLRISMPCESHGKPR